MHVLTVSSKCWSGQKCYFGMLNILIPVRKMFPVFHSSLLLLVLICFLCPSLVCMHVHWSNKPNFHSCLIWGEISSPFQCVCVACGCVYVWGRRGVWSCCNHQVVSIAESSCVWDCALPRVCLLVEITSQSVYQRSSSYTIRPCCSMIMLLGHNSKLHPQTFPQSLQKVWLMVRGRGKHMLSINHA